MYVPIMTKYIRLVNITHSVQYTKKKMKKVWNGTQNLGLKL